MATVIKRGAQQGVSGVGEVRGVPMDFEDIAGRADAYVDSVRREAAKIVQAAHEEAAAVRKQAQEAGRAAAEAEIERLLRERVAGEVARLRPQVDAIVRELTEARSAWLDYWRGSAVDLAVRIAERILHRELERRPELSDAWLREALTLVAGAVEVRVRLHPDAVRRLEEHTETIAKWLRDVGDARLVADDAIEAHGCVVETRFGEVDVRLSSQLARLAEELK